jgi:hypothetical protein
MAWLSGYKTYILAICVVIVAAAHHFGWLDDKLFTTLIAVLVGGGMFTLRSAVKAEVKKEVKKAAKQ